MCRKLALSILAGATFLPVPLRLDPFEFGNLASLRGGRVNSRLGSGRWLTVGKGKRCLGIHFNWMFMGTWMYDTTGIVVDVLLFKGIVPF